MTSESGSNANRTFTFNNTKLTRETVNTERQISNENGATISLGKRKFTHDDNGNRVVENNADNETVAAYRYDPFDKLINTETASKEASYSYRPDDLMLSKTATDGEKIYFIWHAGQIIAEIKGNGSVTNNYYYGLERIQSTKFGYYLHDAHGDVIGLANASGVATKSYSYDANGNEKNPSSSDLNPFRYCGEYFDGDTKLYYLRARWYDPSVGEFLTVDPARDGYNWYVYCENNPVKFVDPSGLYSILSTQDQEKWDAFWLVGPWDALTINSVANKSYTLAQQYAKEKELESLTDNEADAFRHFSWNYNSVRERISVENVSSIMTNHEVLTQVYTGTGEDGSKYYKVALSSLMDLTNNQIGRYQATLEINKEKSARDVFDSLLPTGGIITSLDHTMRIFGIQEDCLYKGKEGIEGEMSVLTKGGIKENVFDIIIVNNKQIPYC